MAQMGRRLASRGWDVDILTTTALDPYSWGSHFPEGSTFEHGVTVRRFQAVRDADPRRAQIEADILSGIRPSIQDQQRWMNSGVRIPGLFHHLLDRAAEYRAITFGPYLFWPAFACSQVAPERSLLWTCLHDEPQAYLDLFQPVFTGIAGLFLQTEPEHDLAHRVVPRGLADHGVVGCGVEVPDSYDVEGFRKRYEVEDPYVLYAGRREGAKGWEEFLDSFSLVLARRDLPFKLVTIGVGDVQPPAEIRDRVIDLGFLPEYERDAAFAAAEAYIQTSKYESFSRTVMEAWLAGTPVIANAQSDVVRWHCERSGAGLVYADIYELMQCLSFVAEAPDSARELGSHGRSYVLKHYQWEDVLDRVEERIAQWTNP
jgi:glycosyltransferase involved in cell wall biosynthesis